MPRVTIIGITDSGAESLPPGLLKRVTEADVVCGGERHLALFPQTAAERWVIRDNLPELAARLKAEALGKRIVIVASGDPYFYGIGSYLARHMPREWLEVFPNVTAVQLAFARLNESWHDAVVVSAHGRPLEPMITTVRAHPKVAILTDDQHTPAAVARALLDAGVADRRAVVCEHLGGSRERVVETTLADLPRQEYAPLNVLILLGSQAPVPPVSQAQMFGLADDGFTHRGGMVTKQEVRAISLAKLRLRADSTVWDIGAGAGAVTIEAARIAHRGTVYAVERRPEAIALIRENLGRFQTLNVQIVQAVAPEGLASLPDPDSVFIGGSGGHMQGIIQEGVKRLRPGGNIVVNAITLESVHEALAALQTHGFAVEVTLVNIARSKTLGERLGFEALNPIYVMSARREAEA
jgi:precorrin-6B C5,15-methyltransferase / cobalt-precorrin-6B C5,C15-methyltransferase